MSPSDVSYTGVPNNFEGFLFNANSRGCFLAKVVRCLLDMPGMGGTDYFTLRRHPRLPGVHRQEKRKASKAMNSLQNSELPIWWNSKAKVAKQGVKWFQGALANAAMHLFP